MTLKAIGEVDAVVQNTSRVRTWVQAKLYFDIGGMSDDLEYTSTASEDRLEDSFRKFLDQAGEGRAPNDTRKD